MNILLVSLPFSARGSRSVMELGTIFPFYYIIKYYFGDT